MPSGERGIRQLPSGERGIRQLPSDERGFTLVGAMIAVLIVNVTLGVAVTSWVTRDRRANEAELIWRGQAIVRAIACYQGVDAGEPLERLEQLVEASCLRRLKGDPMVKGGKWRILRQADVVDGTVAALLGQPLPGEEGATMGPRPPGGQSGGQSGGAAGGMGSAGSMGGTGSGFSLGIGGPAGPQGQSGGAGGLRMRLSATSSSAGQAIVGVVSTSERASLRQYNGRQKYSEWAFVSQGAPAQ